MKTLFKILTCSLFLNIAGNVAAQDAIDLSRAKIVNAPEVRTWASTARITAVTFENGKTRVEFTKKDGSTRWPDVRPAGWAGDLQYTLWLFVKNGDEWAGSAFIQFWHGRDGSGSAADPDVPSVYEKHWYYSDRWAPIYGHGPLHQGEQIGFMVTSGNERDSGGPFGPQERSNVVVFAATDSGTYNFAITEPTPEPAPAPLPSVPTVPPSTGIPQPLPSVPTVDTACLAAIADLKATMTGQHQDQIRTVNEAMKDFAVWFVRNGLPAVLAAIGTWQIA